MDEKDFIPPQEKSPYPIWLWLFLIAIFVGLLWQSGIWYTQDREDILPVSSAFYNVSNREMSVFLWQNPEFMRANVQNKDGYLPGFDTSNQIAVSLGMTSLPAIGPADLFFRYHTWKRLLFDQTPLSPVNNADFREFLSSAPEWLPINWPNAPAGYKNAIQTGDFSNLPKAVLLSYQGWKNLFLDRKEIEIYRPTYAELARFLKVHPHYARHYWRNIEGYDYLYTFTIENFDPKNSIPPQEMPLFLKQALFSFSIN